LFLGVFLLIFGAILDQSGTNLGQSGVTLSAFWILATIPFDGMSCERSFRQKELFPLANFVDFNANLGHFGVTLGTFFDFCNHSF
jgi:hypothetical protein